MSTLEYPIKKPEAKRRGLGFFIMRGSSARPEPKVLSGSGEKPLTPQILGVKEGDGRPNSALGLSSPCFSMGILWPVFFCLSINQLVHEKPAGEI